MRLEPAIEDQREIVQSDFTFVAGLENMHVHPFGQIVAVKADPVAVLDENRGHDETELVATSRANQTKIQPAFSFTRRLKLSVRMTARLCRPRTMTSCWSRASIWN